MKKPKSITLPELVRSTDTAELVAAVGCDRTLPQKWEKGQRPGWRNTEKLVAFAKSKGFTLTILGGVH